MAKGGEKSVLLPLCKRQTKSLIIVLHYVSEVRNETKHLNAWSSTSWNFIKNNRNKQFAIEVLPSKYYATCLNGYYEGLGLGTRQTWV